MNLPQVDESEAEERKMLLKVEIPSGDVMSCLVYRSYRASLLVAELWKTLREFSGMLYLHLKLCLADGRVLHNLELLYPLRNQKLYLRIIKPPPDLNTSEGAQSR